MHDKSQMPADEARALPGHRIVALTGRDAAAFAQAQFMNDLNGLQPGQWQWNGWLTPKGRVLALFALLKWSDQQLWLIVPDAEPVALADALGRFVFRSKVRIELRDDLQIAGRFVLPDLARGNTFVGSEDDGVELDLGADGGSRCLLIRSVRNVAGVANERSRADEGFETRWRLFDLEHGFPRLPPSQVERWTPQQLSLERLHGFSIKKGCYPGQEIVARTHFLGKAKRGLVLLEGDGPMDAGAEMSAGDAVIGSVIASADDDGQHVALAVLPLGREDTKLAVERNAVREAPMKSGLAR